MTTPLTSPFVQGDTTSTKHWRRVLNHGNTSHRTKVQAEGQTLYVCGTAFDRNRFITRSGVPVFKKPLDQRRTLSIYQDTDHSYIRLHTPCRSQDLIYGKYALNRGLIKLSSNGQVIAYSLPTALRRSIGIIMIGLCWLISFIATIFPRKARLNDEVRLYKQVGQDFREHPNITFEVTEDEFERIRQYIQQLLKDPESTTPPLRFRTIGNNCSGFPRDVFLLTGYPGGFTDYFEEEAIRTRGFGFVGSVLDAHGFGEALVRLFKTFGSLLGILKHKTYLPPVTLKNVKEELLPASHALAHTRQQIKQVPNCQPVHAGKDAMMRYFFSGHRFGYCERLQRSGHYHAAVHELEVILNDLDNRVHDKAYGIHATPESLYRDKSELLFCQAIAEKISHKIRLPG